MAVFPHIGGYKGVKAEGALLRGLKWGGHCYSEQLQSLHLSMKPAGNDIRTISLRLPLPSLPLLPPQLLLQEVKGLTHLTEGVPSSPLLTTVPAGPRDNSCNRTGMNMSHDRRISEVSLESSNQRGSSSGILIGGFPNQGFLIRGVPPSGIPN